MRVMAATGLGEYWDAPTRVGYSDFDFCGNCRTVSGWNDDAVRNVHDPIPEVGEGYRGPHEEYAKISSNEEPIQNLFVS